MTTLSEAFQAAFAHHQRGELAQAQTIYRQILDAEPQHADAWHLLGLVAHQEGRNDEALNSISRAINLNDKQPAYHNHLGAVYAVVGELEKAEASFRRALELSPSDAQVHYNLAALLNLRGDPQAAIDHYRRAIEVMESVRARLGTGEDKASFLQNQVEIYKNFVGLLVNAPARTAANEAEAFHYAEKARSRALLDLLAEARVDLEQEIDADLRTRQQQIQQQIAETQKKLMQADAQKLVTA